MMFFDQKNNTIISKSSFKIIGCQNPLISRINGFQTITQVPEETPWTTGDPQKVTNKTMPTESSRSLT